MNGSNPDLHVLVKDAPLLCGIRGWYFVIGELDEIA